MVNVKEFVSISGMSGIYKMVAGRKDGLIIEDFDTQKRQFVASRAAAYTALEVISIYTDDNGSTPLSNVLTTLKAKADAGEMPPSEKSDNATLRAFMADTLPNYDRDRVHTSDMKKLIKWFNFLYSRNLLHETETQTAEEPLNTETEVSATAE
jgi:hypothetical protein